MSRTVPTFLIPILCFSMLGFIRAPDAEAIPAFAKKYEVSCTLCHTVWPKLNHFGEEFFANGFQLPDTEDGGEVQKIRPDDYIALDSGNANPPVSVRVNVEAFVVRETELKGSGVDTRDDVLASRKTDVTVFGGGTLNKNVSYFFSGVGRDTFQAWGQINNVFRPGMFNIRWGLLPVAEFDAVPQQRNHFDGPKPLFDMGEIDLGFKIYGKPMNEGLWYSIGWFRGGEGKRSVDAFSGDNNTAASAMVRYDFGLASVSYRIFAKKTEPQVSGTESTDHLGHYVSARVLFKSFDIEGSAGFKTEEPDVGADTDQTGFQLTGTYFTDLFNFQVSYYHTKVENDDGVFDGVVFANLKEIETDGFGARIEGFVTTNGRVYLGYSFEDIDEVILQTTGQFEVNEFFFGMDWAF